MSCEGPCLQAAKIDPSTSYKATDVFSKKATACQKYGASAGLEAGAVPADAGSVLLLLTPC